MPVNSRVQTKSLDYGISEASYECDSGYELFGSMKIKCDPIKGWERELPFCGKIVFLFTGKKKKLKNLSKFLSLIRLLGSLTHNDFHFADNFSGRHHRSVLL